MIEELSQAELDPARTYIIHADRVEKERWEETLTEFVDAGGECIVVSERNLEDIVNAKTLWTLMGKEYATYETESTEGNAMFIVAKKPDFEVKSMEAQELRRDRVRINWSTHAGNEYAQHLHEPTMWQRHLTETAKMIRYKFDPTARRTAEQAHVLAIKQREGNWRLHEILQNMRMQEEIAAEMTREAAMEKKARKEQYGRKAKKKRRQDAGVPRSKGLSPSPNKTTVIRKAAEVNIYPNLHETAKFIAEMMSKGQEPATSPQNEGGMNSTMEQEVKKEASWHDNSSQTHSSQGKRMRRKELEPITSLQKKRPPQQE